MSFVKKSANIVPIVDTVFTVVDLAMKAKKQHGDERVIDATIGSLYDEAGQLVAMESVFASYDALPSKVKAKYASNFSGNENYRKQVKEWIWGNQPSHLSSSVIATPGGSGAISMCFDTFLDIDETVILPDIAWSSYELMAQQKQLQYITYRLFDQDGFTLDSLKECCTLMMRQQGKVVVVINDPCHNPTGYSMSVEQWDEVISFLNELSQVGNCIVINDIAYIDYSYNHARSRDYLQVFNTINENVMVVIAFSCSKSLTSYGLRMGAAMILAKKEEDVRNAEIVMEKTARSIWSNAANAAMENFVEVTTTHVDAFNAERQYYVDLLKKRSDIFMNEAIACKLPIYPYREGFFITIRIDDNDIRDLYHQALLDHLIFTIKVNKGIRVAICSLSVNHCKGLAMRMKEILEQIK